MPRGQFQTTTNTKIQGWIEALERGDFDTFNSGYGCCRDRLVQVLKEIRGNVGNAGGAMDRNSMMAKARDVSETLLIHLLRRRRAQGNRPPPTPLSLEQLEAKSLDWYKLRKDEVLVDVNAQPPPRWLARGTTYFAAVQSDGSHIQRLCRMIVRLHELATKYHHQVSHEADKASIGEVNRELIEPLEELFRKDDSRSVRARRERILM